MPTAETNILRIGKLLLPDYLTHPFCRDYFYNEPSRETIVFPTSSALPAHVDPTRCLKTACIEEITRDASGLLPYRVPQGHHQDPMLWRH